MDNNELIEWLSGPRDMVEGAALYSKYGKNLRLKKIFAVDGTSTARAMLTDEIRRLAGLTEAQFAALPRRAKGTATPLTHGGTTVNKPVSEVTAKMLSFRDRYPFLSDPSCPDELKIAVSDMFTAYGRYKEAHARLREMSDDADIIEAAPLCETIVEQHLNNRALWEELDHYAATGEMLGKAIKIKAKTASEEIAALTDVELLRKLQSARTNASKRKKELESLAAAGCDTAHAEESLAQWVARRDTIQAEVDRRKKK